MEKVFTLHIRTDNAAFEDDPRTELIRLLKETADRIEKGTLDQVHWFQTIRDINGNDVGQFALKPADYK